MNDCCHTNVSTISGSEQTVFLCAVAHAKISLFCHVQRPSEILRFINVDLR